MIEGMDARFSADTVCSEQPGGGHGDWMLTRTCEGCTAVMLYSPVASNCTGRLYCPRWSPETSTQAGIGLRREVSDEVAWPARGDRDLPRRARDSRPAAPPAQNDRHLFDHALDRGRQDVHGHDGAPWHAQPRRVLEETDRHHVPYSRGRSRQLDRFGRRARQPLDFAFGAHDLHRRGGRHDLADDVARRRCAFDSGNDGHALADRHLEGQADGRRDHILHPHAGRRRDLVGDEVEHAAAFASRREVHQDDEITAAKLAERRGGATHAYVREAQRVARQLERLGDVLEFHRHAEGALRLLLACHRHPQHECEGHGEDLQPEVLRETAQHQPNEYQRWRDSPSERR